MRDDVYTAGQPAQPSLFPRLDSGYNLTTARCWLIVPEAEQFESVLRVLLSRRHVIVDPESGASAIGESDLLLLLCRDRREIFYIGPGYLYAGLPEAFKCQGIEFLAENFDSRNVISFAEQRTARPYSALEFRSGPSVRVERDIIRSPLHPLLRELQRMAERAPERASDYLAQASTGISELVSGLLCFEAGATMLAESPRLTDRELQHARQFFSDAVMHMGTAGHESARRASIVGRERAERLLFDRRQFAFDLEGGFSRSIAHQQDPGLGYRAHPLFALPLPAIPLHRDGAAVRFSTNVARRVLFRTSIRQSLLQRLLSRSSVDHLTGSVREVGIRESKAVSTVARGVEIKFAAILNTHLHQNAGVSSMVQSEVVTIQANSASLEVSPPHKLGQIGKYTHFGVIGRKVGSHEIRFTFLTGGKVVSRIKRTIRILAE